MEAEIDLYREIINNTDTSFDLEELKDIDDNCIDKILEILGDDEMVIDNSSDTCLEVLDLESKIEKYEEKKEENKKYSFKKQEKDKRNYTSYIDIHMNVVKMLIDLYNSGILPDYKDKITEYFSVINNHLNMNDKIKNHRKRHERNLVKKYLDKVSNTKVDCDFNKYRTLSKPIITEPEFLDKIRNYKINTIKPDYYIQYKENIKKCFLLSTNIFKDIL
jgi:hypothetical protein